MSEENVELVREIWDAYSRGDFDQIRARSDPDVVMITMAEGPLYGLEAVRRDHERWWEAWENPETTAEEVIGVGDRVFVMARFRGRGRASGVEVEGHHLRSTGCATEGRPCGGVQFERGSFRSRRAVGVAALD